MKTRQTLSCLWAAGRRRLVVGVTAALLVPGLAVEPVQAITSSPTGGRIHGRAPTVTGTPTILLPDGTTALTDGAQVSWSASPGDFTLGPLTPGLTYSDEDGDLPATPDAITLANPPGVTWTWMQGTTPLTSAQMNQPFQNNFADGTVLTVSASVPVTVASASGLPDAGEQIIPTPFYTVVVKAPLPTPVIRVNGATFALTDGFPTTAFENAQFQFYMNGVNAADNDKYHFSSNIPGIVQTSADGAVWFAQRPTPAQKHITITIADKTGLEPSLTYQITLNSWFVYLGRGANAQDHIAGTPCGNEGAEVPTADDLLAQPHFARYGNNAAAGREVGNGLWGEWGSLVDSAGWVPLNGGPFISHFPNDYPQQLQSYPVVAEAQYGGLVRTTNNTYGALLPNAFILLCVARL